MSMKGIFDKLPDISPNLYCKNPLTEGPRALAMLLSERHTTSRGNTRTLGPLHRRFKEKILS